MLYNFSKYLLMCIIWTNMSCFCSNTFDSEEKMPFKLGFEFQESNHLAEWAKDNIRIQKKSIMTCKVQEKTLWKVVIDDCDIEFVLEPFSRQEGKLLENAIETMQIACKELSNLFKVGKLEYNIKDITKALSYINISENPIQRKRQFENIGCILYKSYGEQGFEVWKKWIISKANNDSEIIENIEPTDDIKKQWQASKLHSSLKSIILLARTSSNKNNIPYVEPNLISLKVTFQNWYDSIVKTFAKNNFSINPDQETWQEVQNQQFKELSQEKTLEFSPQATIQYPLKYTIPLWFSIFGYESSTFDKHFSTNLPDFPDQEKTDKTNSSSSSNQEKTDNKYNHYATKEIGLLFLHAMTVHGMMPNLDKDTDLLLQTRQRYNDYGQVDAKVNLQLMSRRPFSEMRKSILADKYSFAKDYKLHMSNKKNFSSSEEFSIPKIFNKTNYANEYLSVEKIGRVDLSVDFMPKEIQTNYFNSKFLNDNKEQLEYLLKNGILSTTMIRNFEPEAVKVFDINNDIQSKTPEDIFSSYYNATIDSIDKPSYRYDFDIKNKRIIKKLSNYDALSRPWFLDETDAMGYYTKNINLECGEAIIEARQIKNVGKFFLKKTDQDSNKLGFYLKKLDNLKEEALALFSFLCNFKDFISINSNRNAIFSNMDSSSN